MKWLLDSANLNDIREAAEFFPICGVTTNPTLLAREKAAGLTSVKEHMLKIREMIGPERELHMQVIAKDADGMIAEAREIAAALGENTFVKIPVGEEGLKACKALSAEGIDVTMTAVFSPMQALAAALAGARYAAPYVNRLDKIAGDGAGVVEDITEILDRYGLECEVLAASFQTPEQLLRCALGGAHAATAGLSVLKLAISHPLTDAAVAGFDRDWENAYGDATVRDLMK